MNDAVTAVITGIGVAAPNGLGTEPFWAATLAGRSGIDQLTRFDPAGYPASLAGEVRGFAAEEYLPSRLLPQTDHTTRLALVAADLALRDAGVDPGEAGEYDIGVVTSTSAGGFEFGQRELQNMWSKGGSHVSAYQSFAWFYAVNTGQISIRHGLRGSSSAVVTDQAGGLDALGQARRRIRNGTPVMVAGGVDGCLCPWGLTAQLASGRLTTAARPDRAYLPFDGAASGHVPGEGGAILVVEDRASASRRGAGVYGEVAGYAATFDSDRPGRPPALGRAIELALGDARVGAGDIGVVFADAAAVPDLDRAEAAAISAVFGPFGVPVTAPKTMTGRLCSGAGPVDVATALLAIRDGVIPPTINVSPLADYQLDLVTGAPRPSAIGAALVLGRGYGGFNSAVVVRGC